jgi:hypothetical protein
MSISLLMGLHCSCHIEECDPSNIAFHTSNELKSNLLEGAATLYVIDEDKSKHAMQLARSLSSVPELVKSQLEELRKNLAVEARVSTPSIWSLALLPIFDHSSVLKEMELISQIMHALADSILDKVSNVIDFFVLHESATNSFLRCSQSSKKFVKWLPSSKTLI